MRAGADEGETLNACVDDTHENVTPVGVAELDIKRVGMVGGEAKCTATTFRSIKARLHNSAPSVLRLPLLSYYRIQPSHQQNIIRGLNET